MTTLLLLSVLMIGALVFHKHKAPVRKPVRIEVRDDDAQRRR
ncbi:MAG: hypothetical protein ACX931_14920 [Saccharospirillum sp.]